MLEFQAIFDFVNAVALVAVLSWGYGLLRRRLSGEGWAPVILGFLFGCVAVIEMNTPILARGLVIDLRCVPVALAGAFLGWRGLVMCLAVAISARLHIGGDGVPAGVLAMLIAGCGGLAWDRLTAKVDRRGARHLALLGLTTTSSLLAALVLPRDLTLWFLVDVGPSLGLVYVLAVPFTAALLERERVIFEGEMRARTLSAFDGMRDLRSASDFAREVAHLNASGADMRLEGVVELSLRHGGFMTDHWGGPQVGQIVGGLRHRLSAMVRHGGLLGATHDGRILIPVTAEEMRRSVDLLVSMQRAVSDRVVTLSGQRRVNVAVSARMVALSDPAGADSIVDDLHQPARQVVHDPSEARAPAARRPEDGRAHARLFARLDALMAANPSS